MTLYGPERRAHEQGWDDPLADEIADMREWRAQKYMPIYDCVVRISQPVQAGRVRFPGGSYDPTAGPPETVTRCLKEYIAHMEEEVWTAIRANGYITSIPRPDPSKEAFK